MSGFRPPQSLLPGAQVVGLEQIVDRFREAWKRGERPAIEQYLPTDPALQGPALVQLVCIDIEYRRRIGEAAPLAEYLARFPELDSAEHAMALLQLGGQQRTPQAGRDCTAQDATGALSVPDILRRESPRNDSGNTSPVPRAQSPAEQRILQALDRLIPHDRELLVMRHQYRLPFAEIARRLNCSVEAARQQWWHAFQSFQQAYTANP